MPTLLMTRPRPAAEGFVAQLSAPLRARLRVVYSPLLEIVPLKVQVPDDGLRGVIFTSVNGVEAGLAAGAPGGLPAYCVGDRTARAALAAGWRVQVTCPDAEHLIAALLRLRPEAPLLHLRGVHARGDIAGRLSAAGIATRALAVYDQRLLPLNDAARSALAGQGPVVVPLFSPRTARQFADICDGSAPLFLAVISAAAAKPVENMRSEALIVAERPDSPAMIAAVEMLVRRASRLEGPGGAQ